MTNILIFLGGTVAMALIVLGGLWVVLKMSATDAAAERIRQARGISTADPNAQRKQDDLETLAAIEQWREGR
jgi:hypothetical protein